MSLRKEYILGAKDETGAATRSAKKNFEDLGLSSKLLKANIVALVGVGGFASLVTSAIAAGDELNRMASRTNISVEALSQYQYVAKLAKVDFDTLTNSMGTMTRKISEAAKGTGEGKDALLELGLSAKKLNELKPDQQFEVMADALNGVANANDRARIASKLFGDNSAALMEVMKDGSAGIRAMRDESDELGLTLDKKLAGQMTEARKIFDSLTSSGAGIGRMIAAELMPSLLMIGRWLAEALPAAINLAGQAWATLRHFILEGIQLISEGLAKMYDWLSRLPGTLGDSYAAARDKVLDFSKSIESTQHFFALATEQNAAFRVGQETAEAEHQARMTSLTLSETERRTAAQKKAEDKAAKDRAKTEQWLANTKIQMQQAVWNNAVGLLQTLSGKNKTAAALVIAIQKGLAIAQIKVNTAVAATRAIAELGPIAGPPAAAAITKMGFASMALVAAAGLAEISQLGSGGAESGTPANPIHTTTSSFSQDQGFGTHNLPSAQSSGKTVNINVYGPMFGGRASLEYIAEAVKQSNELDMLTIRTQTGRAEVF